MKITKKQRIISFVINITLLLATWVGMVYSAGSYRFWAYVLCFFLVLVADFTIGAFRDITEGTEMQEMRDPTISQVNSLLDQGALYKVSSYEAQTILNILKKYESR